MDRLRNILVTLRGQFWLLPLAMSLAAITAALAILASGWNVASDRAELWWLYSGDADAARGLLSSFLSGLLTMTSLVISITFVILTLSANQLGPRLIWSFIGDWQIQAVLGLFLSTIFYVLIVLRTLDDALGPDGIPHLAVTVASGLTALCLFALLFYVHKIARSIVADTVITRVGDELRAAIQAMLAEEEPAEAGVGTIDGAAHDGQAETALGRAGYVQMIDYGALVDLARRLGVVLRVRVKAGDFVLRDGVHIVVEGVRALPDDAARSLRDAVTIGANRSPAQDLEYSIRQLVEIALRALSPGINDTYTAIGVIDRLTASLEEILARPQLRTAIRDRKGRIRVHASRVTAASLVHAAFDPIRQAGSSQAIILQHLADSLAKLTPAGRARTSRPALLEQLERLNETAAHSGMGRSDLDATLARIDEARLAFAQEEAMHASAQPRSSSPSQPRATP